LRIGDNQLYLKRASNTSSQIFVIRIIKGLLIIELPVEFIEKDIAMLVMKQYCFLEMENIRSNITRGNNYVK